MPVPPLLQSNLDLPLAAPRQGARRLRGRPRPAADRRHRPHLGVRLRAGLGHPRQGPHPVADVGRSGSACSPTSSRTTCCRPTPADFPAEVARARGRAARPHRCWCGAPTRCPSSAWRAATSRARAGRTTSAPARCAASRCRRACVESSRLPAPIFTPATKAESGHDENISEAQAAAQRRRRRWSARLRDADARPLRAAAPRTPSARASSSPTRSSSSAACAGAGERAGGSLHHPDRRGAHARLVAVLAGGPVRARRAAAELRQAVRARLPRADPLEQAAARARAARRRRREDATRTWKRISNASRSRRLSSRAARRSQLPARQGRHADMRAQLEALVQAELVDEGRLLRRRAEGVRAPASSSRPCSKAEGSISGRPGADGRPPQHPHAARVRSRVTKVKAVAGRPAGLASPPLTANPTAL